MLFRSLIASINYYRQFPLTEIKWTIGQQIKFSKIDMRYDRTFNTILKYIAAYSDSQEEFNELSNELYVCYKKYDTLLIKEKRKIK